MGPGRCLFLAMVWTGKHLFLNYNHEKGSDEYLLKVTVSQISYLKKPYNIKFSSNTLLLCLRLDDSKLHRIFIVYIVLYCIFVIIFIYKSVYS